MITLTIPATPPSPNKRLHWRQRWKVANDWKRWVWATYREQLIGFPKPIVRAKLSIERRGKLMDVDNLYASMKPVIDALKVNGLIVDDSPKHLELTVTQVRGKAQTLIQLEAT